MNVVATKKVIFPINDLTFKMPNNIDTALLQDIQTKQSKKPASSKIKSINKF